ncbi:MAG: hypothetical protein K0U98_00780 [Deltaproteobacteria bacterium]|nr:hypothetical protein [Deltaproteobacteria bacterium]
MEKLTTKIRYLIGLALIAVSGLVAMGSWGSTDGWGQWRYTDRSDSNQAYCDANFPFTICAEWCELVPDPNSPIMEEIPTGNLCCMDSGSQRMRGTLGDCENPI